MGTNGAAEFGRRVGFSKRIEGLLVGFRVVGAFVGCRVVGTRVCFVFEIGMQNKSGYWQTVDKSKFAIQCVPRNVNKCIKLIHALTTGMDVGLWLVNDLVGKSVGMSSVGGRVFTLVGEIVLETLLLGALVGGGWHVTRHGNRPMKVVVTTNENRCRGCFIFIFVFRCHGDDAMCNFLVLADMPRAFDPLGLQRVLYSWIRDFATFSQTPSREYIQIVRCDVLFIGSVLHRFFVIDVLLSPMTHWRRCSELLI